MEVAALGLRVDANGVDSAAKSLENLTVQGAKAEKAIVGVEGAASKAGKSLKSLGEGSAKGLEDINKVAPNSAEGLGRVSKSAEDAKKKLREMNSEMESGSKAAATMGGATDALSGYVKALAGAAAGISFAGLVKDSTLLAARFETMGVVMGVAGNNAGYTRKEMDDLSKSLQQQGISMLQSRNSLTQLATANIDLSKATGLARSAQDLAVVGNINSSEALERMIHGIKAGEVEVLRTLGLNVSFEASYKKLAQTLGVNTESLDENQKMMARTNAVLDGSTRYLGIYEESMTTAGKAMTSLTRYWEDFKVQAGDTFLPTLATGVFTVTDALKAMNAEIEASGQATDAVGRAINGTFKTTLETVAVLGANVAYVFRAMGLEIGGLAAQAGAVARLDFSGAAEIGRQMKEDAAANRVAIDKFSESVLNSNAAVAVGAKVSEEKRIADGKAAKAAEEAANKTLAQKTALTAFTKQFGTDAEKNKIAADEWKAKLGDLWSPEMIAKIEKRGKAAAASAKMEQTEYQRLMATVKAKIATNEEELFAGGKLNESAKLRIQLQAQLDSGSKKLTAAHKAEIKQQIDKLEAQEKEEKAIKRAITLNDARLAQDQEMAEAQAAMQAKVDAVRLSIYDYSVAVKDSIEMSNLEFQTLGMSSVARNTLIEQLRIEQDLRKRIEAIKAAPYDSQEARDADIAKITAEAMKAKANAQTKAYVSEWEKSFDQTSQALTDALMRGGKDAGDYLVDYFRTLVLRPVIKAIVDPIAAPITSVVQSTLGQGAGGAGGGMTNSLMNNMGLLGAGAQAMWGLSAGASTASLAAANAAGAAGGDALGTLIAANGQWAGVATEAASTAGTLLSSIGSAIPWIAGGFAIGSMLGLFDDKSTQEYGGTAMYSAALGSQASTAHGAFGTGFGGVAANDQILANVAGISKSIVDALDATAKTFGQTVGYEAAAGFASDFGDEATWGGLRIALQGKDIVNWDDTRSSKWAPKEFASGDEGYKQYLNAVALDVKTALLGMDLPTWASQLVSAATDLDTINAALQQIGTVKAVFDGLGQSMSMFSGISGELQTQLLSMSGSIDALSSNAGAFYEGFYSEQERMDILARNLRESLSGLNLSIDPALGDDAKESFRAAVEGAMDAGQGELAAKLLAMSGSFATAADYAQKQAEESSQAIISAAQEAAQAAQELASSLRSSLIGLEARFAEGGFSRQYQAQDAAGVLQGLFAGVGIEKDAGQLTQQILAATAPEIEAYFRSMWGMLDTDEARSKLVDVTGSLLDLAEAAKQSAEAVDNAAKQQRESLEQQYLQLIGNTAELRRRELEALDPSNRALQQLIWSIQDGQSAFSDMSKAVDSAANAAKQAWSNWGTANNLGLKYLGDTSGLEAQRAILQAQIGNSSDPADRLSKLQELIGIEEALGNAEMANRKAEQAAINARQTALQKELSAAQALLSAAQSLGDYAKSLQTSTASGLSDTDRLAALGSQYTMLMGKARGGDNDALSQLQGVSSDYLGLAQTLAVSGSDYSVLSGRIASELDKLATGQESTANWQISSAQSQLDQLTAQSEALSAQIEISDATKGLIAKSMIDQAEIWDRENTQYLSMISLQEQMTGKLGLLPTDIYKALKPAMDSSASYIASSVGGAVSGAINSLAGMLGLGGMPAFASGGYHVGGLRIVGENGPELEATGPSRIWNQSQIASALGGGQGNAALISEVRALREQNARLEARLATIEQNTAQLADQFDNVTAGGNAMATEAMA